MAAMDDESGFGLTEAEREAMGDDDGGDLDSVDELKALLNSDDGEDGEGEAEADAKDQGAADTGAADDTASRYQPEPDEPEMLVVGDVDAWKTERDGLQKQLAELKREFQEEDTLDFDEYEAKRDEIQVKLNRLDVDLGKAQDRQETNEKRFAAYNDKLAVEIEARGKKEGIDYANTTLATEFDGYLQAIRNNPANTNLSLRQAFAKAHEMVKVMHGIAPAPRQDKTAPGKADPTQEAIRQRRERQPKAPPSLALVPEAGAEAVDEGEFSHIDRLSGLALERALARLSPEQQERYLTGAAA